MEFLYTIPAWIIASGLFLGLLVGAEFGFRVGQLAKGPADEATDAGMGIVKGALLALVGLLLGFSFSMAASRFDARKDVILREANAIGTVWLRAGLLQAGTAAKMRGVLRRYVDVRVEHYDAGIDPTRIASTAAEAERLQSEVWGLLESEANAEPARAPVVSLFAQSLNEMIDLSSEREAVRRNHVPEAVLLLLFASTLLCSIVVGHSFGRSGRRSWLASIAFALLVTMVIFVVIDLDRPTRGLIRVGQDSMIALQLSLRGSAAR
jgi:hypothetical protein